MILADAITWPDVIMALVSTLAMLTMVVLAYLFTREK